MFSQRLNHLHCGFCIAKSILRNDLKLSAPKSDCADVAFKNRAASYSRECRFVRNFSVQNSAKELVFLLHMVYNKNMEDRTMEGKRLYRSRKDRMICGVCGGIAKYFNIDPTLVRLAFVLISMGAGSGVLAYIVAAIIIPDDPEEN